jgi:hypothetical protein
VFRWQQNGITIRHADTVDVKFNVWTAGEPEQEKVIALRHPDLLRLSRETGQILSDAWCMKLSALHLKYMIETDEDMERTLVTAPYAKLVQYHKQLAEMPQPVQG